MTLVIIIAAVVIIIICVLLILIIQSKKKKNYAKVKVVNGKTAFKDDNTGSLDLLDFESKDQATVLLNGEQNVIWISLTDTQDSNTSYSFYLRDYVVVGREELKGVNGYCILDQKLSRRHCKFSTNADGVVWLEDLGSTNHTYVNGIQIKQKSHLEQGDKIIIGGSEYTFRSERV